MECLRFTIFKKIVYIGLFENVSNSQNLLERIQQAAKLEGPEGNLERDTVNYSFIDAKLVTSLLHLQVALAQSLLAEAEGKLRTKTVHSEIIWTLNPTNNITEALRRFGISKATKTLILVQALEDSILNASEVEDSMKKLIRGSLIPIERLSQHTDWVQVRKVYKLNDDITLKDLKDENALRSKIDAIVVATVATKTIQA